MRSRQSKPTIVGGDGYYPVAHREDESFSEIRARMEKEERTGAERKGIAEPPADDKRAQVDISIDPLPEEDLVLTRTSISSPAGTDAGDDGGSDVVSAAELFGKPGFAFTEEFNRTPPRRCAPRRTSLSARPRPIPDTPTSRRAKSNPRRPSFPITPRFRPPTVRPSQTVRRDRTRGSLPLREPEPPISRPSARHPARQARNLRRRPPLLLLWRNRPGSRRRSPDLPTFRRVSPNPRRPRRSRRPPLTLRPRPRRSPA